VLKLIGIFGVVLFLLSDAKNI